MQQTFPKIFAFCQNRTGDLLLTRQTLCHLSQEGTFLSLKILAYIFFETQQKIRQLIVNRLFFLHHSNRLILQNNISNFERRIANIKQDIHSTKKNYGFNNGQI